MLDYALDGWTFFWFFIPMPVLLIWAIITFYTDRGDES